MVTLLMFMVGYIVGFATAALMSMASDDNDE
jgi:hypothetical protein